MRSSAVARLPALVTCFVLAASLLLSLDGSLACQQAAADTRQIHWQRSLDDALALAKATNRPLLLALNMDGESASDRIVHENYRDPEFVAATRDCVCLVASVFRHSPRDHDDDGRRIPCPRLGEITCGEHIALEPLLFERFLADGERVAPRHALIRTDGSKAWDLSLSFDLLDVDKALFATPRTVTMPGCGDSFDAATDWTALVARRDHRGRSALEAAIAAAADEAALHAALDALAAHGDAGALDALRIVAADLPDRSPELRARFVDVARSLHLQAGATAVLRAGLQTLPPRVRAVDLADCAPLLPLLAELDGTAAPTRSLLLAHRALSECEPDARQAVQIAFGAEVAERIDAAVDAHGGTFSLHALLRAATIVTRTAAALPVAGTITDTMPDATALEQQLDALDRELKAQPDDASVRARFAKASLDLARRRLEANQGGADLLLQDAALSFDRALERDATRSDWWIERARTAYFLGRFGEQVTFGRRAWTIANGHEAMPAEGELLDDTTALEALRWVGDGDARLLAERAGGDAAIEISGMLEGLRAFGAVAASPQGNAKDWTSFASFCGALGLRPHELEIARAAAARLPAVREVRASLNDALWTDGRLALAPELADSLVRIGKNAPTADTLWFAGYAWILAAENHRRCERQALAITAYKTAAARFERAATLRADFGANCSYYQALTWLGRGMAHVREGRREAAAACLVHAVTSSPSITDARDGLGYDVFDLVDKIFEWRATGPSPVAPLALLDRLDEAAPDESFWAIAIADSQLREALRADGRNPERAERDTVDAAGDKIRMLMGLPCAEGDAYLAASIAAARRARSQRDGELERRTLAQSLTISAERALERGSIDGVREALTEAAPLLDRPPPTGTDDLGAKAAELRALLGEARPRLRPGR